MSDIGLRGFNERYAGCSIISKIGHLFREIKYAWQRAWKGYDDVEVFAINDKFRECMIEILQDFNKNRIASFWVPHDSEHYEELGVVDNISGSRCFNKTETGMIIDVMIWHLKMMDDTFVEKQIYGFNIYDDEYDPSKISYPHVVAIVKQNKHAFMKLFDLFYENLWD